MGIKQEAGTKGNSGGVNGSASKQAAKPVLVASSGKGGKGVGSSNGQQSVEKTRNLSGGETTTEVKTD